ncbi:MAG: diguanylate cyclase (GGDEF)-like protein/PAS domain S-box-containing protein [Oceanospirillaceae bacterium]|jgi:diguanylate cyclase (GGDEF)-like protein/PAS domain S-box-containing protein
MAIKTKYRIAFKQARFVLVISILLGLTFTCLQLFFDLKQEKQNLIRGIERVINLHKETAKLAVYNLNKSQASEITKTLISQPEIYHAQLIDDFGEVLAEHTRLPLENNHLVLLANSLFQIPQAVATSLDINGVTKGDAQLIIQLDSAYISSAFSQRAVTNLIFSLLFNLVLVSVFVLLFYRYFSRPIENIAQWVEKLRSGQDCTELPYSEPDEIGDLVASFAGLWRERKEVADQLNETVKDLSKSEHFSRSLMDNAGDAMFLCLPDTSIVQVNHQAAHTLGVKKHELEGQKMAQFSINHTQETLAVLFSTFKVKKVKAFEDQQRASQGQIFPIEARGIKLRLQDTNYILIMARDITARKETEQKIYQLAFFDPLTGLPNRRLFLDRLGSAMTLHQTNLYYGAVLYLDLDRFKTINDSLGHGIGDALLCAIAKRLSNILPIKSTCSRFGGDEFVVLLPEMGDKAGISAEAVANISLNILEQMSLPFQVNSHTLYCTTSIGIAMFPEKTADAKDVLRRADTALYRVKAQGRNGFQFFDPEMQSTAQHRLEVEKGLHKALENQEFELWFQPQVGPSGEMIGAEALLRWKHPQKGMLMPEDFINIAQESGQIIEIGNWVLARALQQLVMWLQLGLPATFKRLAVNVSPIQFMQSDFVETTCQLMEELGVPGSMLELEITEDTLVDNFKMASSKMNLLKLHGVSFAIDDFGTGYSSLRYLQHLPLDILKIDRSFVTNLRIDSDEAAIIEVIITTADRLGLTIIAEGVETKEEYEALKSLGCLYYQGYLYSKPLPAAILYEAWCKAA